MRTIAAISVVFCSGFAIMVLEIIGARFLAKDFGSSFYVWVSQIGVVLTALAVGYYVGGALADRTQRLFWLGWLLLPTAAAIWLVPNLAQPVLDAIILRHPEDQPIPPVWMKLDPVLGSLLVFGLPCVVLAMLPTFMIRVTSRRLTHVGRISGAVIAASTVGSIAGVFVSGYVLLDHLRVSQIFRSTGVLIAVLAVLCVIMDRWLVRAEARTDKP